MHKRELDTASSTVVPTNWHHAVPAALAAVSEGRRRGPALVDAPARHPGHVGPHRLGVPFWFQVSKTVSNVRPVAPSKGKEENARSGPDG